MMYYVLSTKNIRYINFIIVPIRNTYNMKRRLFLAMYRTGNLDYFPLPLSFTFKKCNENALIISRLNENHRTRVSKYISVEIRTLRFNVEENRFTGRHIGNSVNSFFS